MKNMNSFEWVVFVLVIAGSINWGLMGFLGFDLLVFLFGTTSFLSRVVYGLLSISSTIMAIRWMFVDQVEINLKKDEIND